MSVPPSQFRVRRITVALRGQAADADLLGSAARLARESAAELSGVFLEDIDLLHLAELPLAIEICRSTCVRRRVEAGEIGRQLASLAATAERALARVAQDAGVTWSFRVARGAVTALLTEVAAEADITLVPAGRRAFWAYGEGASTGSRHERAASAFRAPVAVVFDGSEAAMRALDVGVRLVAAERRPLTVFLLSGDEETGRELRARAEEALGAQAARIHMLVPGDTARLVQVVREQRVGMLVVPALETARLPKTLEALQERLDCPTLLVR